MMNKCALIRTKYIRFMLIRIRRQVGKARFDSTFLSYIAEQKCIADDVRLASMQRRGA